MRDDTATDVLGWFAFGVMVALVQSDPTPFAEQFAPDAQCCT